MANDLVGAFGQHGVELHGEDLQATVSIAAERCVLKTEGKPVHSVGQSAAADLGR